MTKAMLVIGVQKDSIKEARAVILEIMKVKDCGEQVKIAALDTLTNLCAVGNATINNCSFKGK